MHTHTHTLLILKNIIDKRKLKVKFVKRLLSYRYCVDML